MGFIFSLCPSCVDKEESSRRIHPDHSYTLDKVDIDGKKQYHIGINGIWDSNMGSEAITGIAVAGEYLYIRKSANYYSCIKMAKAEDGHINDIVQKNVIKELPPSVKLMTPKVFFESLDDYKHHQPSSEKPSNEEIDRELITEGRIDEKGLTRKYISVENTPTPTPTPNQSDEIRIVEKDK